MRKWLVTYIKNNKISYKIFIFVSRIIINVLRFIFPVNSKKIFFLSFSGKRYDDSPRMIYEKMICDPEFKDYEYVWGFVTPSDFDIPKGRKVKFNSLFYILESLTASIWITNVSIERGVPYKNSQTIYVNTWHGTPLKVIGQNLDRKNIIKSSTPDIICAQSKYDANIFCDFFKVNSSKIIIKDLPRNDAINQYADKQKNAIKERLNIPDNRKLILYMPTYREYWKFEDGSYDMNLPIDFGKWDGMLSSEYIVLVRLHYLVEKVINVKKYNSIVSVSDYPVLSDLYAISDLLISDYSSAYFDYSLTEKPFICFAYDRKEYEEKRGVYFPLEDLGCPIVYDEDSLLYLLLHFDYTKGKDISKRFKDIFAPNAGHATEAVIEEIKRRIQRHD